MARPSRFASPAGLSKTLSLLVAGFFFLLPQKRLLTGGTLRIVTGGFFRFFRIPAQRSKSMPQVTSLNPLQNAPSVQAAGQAAGGARRVAGARVFLAVI